MPKLKKVKVIEPFWKQIAGVLFGFAREHNWGEGFYSESIPRDLKSIVVFLHGNAAKKNAEWTEAIACGMLKYFLNYTWATRHNSSPKWFMIFCNRYKEDILEDIKHFKQSKQLSHD